MTSSEHSDPSPSVYKVTPALLKTSASPSDAILEEGPAANWPTVGGDLRNDRYSSLEAINTENVSKLHLVWQGSFSPQLSAAGLEAESSPLVVEGVMYIVTPESKVVAVNAATGKRSGNGGRKPRSRKCAPSRPPAYRGWPLAMGWSSFRRALRRSWPST